MKRETIVDIISCLFILLFLYTGLIKTLDRPVFLGSLSKSPLLYDIAPLLSYLVPIGELLIVVGLILPKTRRIGLYGSLFLMSVFTVYVGFMLYFRSDRPCTCG